MLFKYLDSDDKYYWIGFFLDEPYYTKINNYELSMKVLKAGLDFVKQDEEKIRYLRVHRQEAVLQEQGKPNPCTTSSPRIRCRRNTRPTRPRGTAKKRRMSSRSLLKSNMK